MNKIKLEQAFSSIKIEIDGKKIGFFMADSIKKNTLEAAQITQISNAFRKKAMLLETDIVRMLKDRNKFALNFGYPNYYNLTLVSLVQTPERVKQLLDEIELKTRAPFIDAKKVIDKILAKHFGIPESHLKPCLHNNDYTS